MQRQNNDTSKQKLLDSYAHYCKKNQNLFRTMPFYSAADKIYLILIMTGYFDTLHMLKRSCRNISYLAY